MPPPPPKGYAEDETTPTMHALAGHCIVKAHAPDVFTPAQESKSPNTLNAEIGFRV